MFSVLTKRYRLAQRLLAFVAVSLLMTVSAWGFSVRSELDPTSPLVGIPARLHIVFEGEGAQDAKISDSFLQDATTTWALVPKPPISKISSNRLSRRVTYEVVPLLSGRQPLPPLVVILPSGESTSFPLETVIIHSHLSRDDMSTLPFGLKLADHAEALIPSPVLKTLPRIVLLAAVLLIAAFATIIIRLMRRRAHPAAAPLPPNLYALAELEKIASEGLIAKRRFKEFYSRVSDVLRSFVGTIWGFPGLEYTTSELLYEVEKKPLPASLRKEIADLLEEADLVKFAKYQPEPTTCERALQRARSLVQSLAALQPQASEAHPQEEGKDA